MTTLGAVETTTLAEAMGMTQELGDAIARIAAEELEGGLPEAARTILDGLVVTNPRDGLAWALLSRVHRALGQPLAGRFCAEVAFKLAPDEPAAMLVRAEELLREPGERSLGLELMASLSSLAGAAGDRARALLAAAAPTGASADP